MEKRPPIRRVNANILKKQSRIADRSGPPAWCLGEVITTSHRKNVSFYEIFTESVYSWIILRWIFRKWDVEVWTGSNWLRIGTVGGYLWMR
jgi:hypothetical protein